MEPVRDKRVETKVVAAPVGGLTGVIVGDFAVYLAGLAWYTPDTVPAPVAAFVVALAVTLFTFGAAWLAPHTYRPPGP